MSYIEKRNFSEILAICRLEPEMRNIIVEGVTDKLVLERFLKKEHKTGISIMNVDMICFDDEYPKLSEEEVKLLKESNKEKVIYLTSKVENVSSTCQLLGIIDRDFDMILKKVRKGRCLAYTDYNSMELYLFKEEYIIEIIANIYRISSNIDVNALMLSIGNVCRFLFFLHSYLIPFNGRMVDFCKSFSYDKHTNECMLDMKKYLSKILQNNKLSDKAKIISDKLRSQLNVPAVDVRLEMRGHDFISVLYHALYKHKRISMSEEDFANSTWLCLDSQLLEAEPLFQRVLAL